MSALLVSFGSFISVFCLVCTVWLAVEEAYNPLQRRLLATTSASGTASANAKRPGFSAVPLWLRQRIEMVLRVLFIEQQSQAQGYRTFAYKVILVVLTTVGTVGGGLLAYQLARHFVFSGMLTCFGTIWIACSGGWFLAKSWTYLARRRWLQEIDSNLIDVLDLWVLCLGAGMGFQSALVRVADDAELAGSALREQLRLTNQEMLAGCPKDEALRHLSRRCGDSADLRSLVSHIIQSERLGTGLAQTLRSFSESLRFKRTQDTKELIQKLPIKLSFPLIFCIMPSLFIVILGPAVIRVFTVFGIK